TFYVAPVLNPDAHGSLFASPRYRRGGNTQPIDRDVDGLVAEDGYDDLNGDGVITWMRIPDPAGSWLPHPEEPRVMVRADPLKERAGAYRMVREGRDDDGDGKYNEDGSEGVEVDRNFAHAFEYGKPEAGPWPSFAPEAKGIMDFLLAHPNVALAVVYGPANNFLALPQSLGGGGDLGTQKFEVPPQAAEFMGLDPEQEYTLDEVWEVAKDLPFVQQNNISKEQIAQFLGAGPATKLEDADQKLLKHLADAYEERLEEAGIDVDRTAEQYRKGGFTPWLYYQYGVMALELDVWAVPKPEKEAEGEEGEQPLTVDRLEEMSADEFLSLGEETVAAFLQEIGAPDRFTASMVRERVESGQVTPEQMAGMIRQMGTAGGGGEKSAEDDDPETERERAVLAWIDENRPGMVAEWTSHTLPDGTEVEIGGRYPFAALAPPLEILEPAMEQHTETVLDLAGKLGRVEIVNVEVRDLGGGVWRIRGIATNRGFLPTHSRMAVRAEAKLPVRLRLDTGNDVELVTGYPTVSGDRLEGRETLEGEWLVRGKEGSSVTMEVVSDASGTDRETITLQEGV
ncbi:MAG: hypothetical protein R3234_09550, partial [Thermoanaerobaculia bacterium]|nr:hypothetical protein [Thermoanaerobaculia bacterium]